MQFFPGSSKEQDEAVVLLHHDESGQDLIEYAMLAGLIALAIIGAIVIFNDALLNLAGGIGNCIDFNNATVCKPGF